LHEYLAMGVHRHQQGDLVGAETFYRRVLEVMPSQTDALHLMGVIHTQLGRPAQAVRLIERAIDSNPTVAMFHNSLGNARNALGQWNLAEASFQQAIELEPGFGEAHFNLSGVYARTGRSDLAETHARLALGLIPDNPAVPDHLASLLIQKGDFSQAVSLAQQSARLDPNHGSALLHLGFAYYRLGRLLDSEKAYLQAVETASDSAEVWNNLAMIALEREDYGLALERIQKAIGLKNQLAEAWNTLGNIHKAMGHVELAWQAYRRASDCNPSEPSYPCNALYLLLFSPNEESQRIRQGREDLARRFFPAQPPPRVSVAVSKYSRRPRLGFLSADFRSHPVGRFLLPLIEHRLRDRFDYHLFSLVKQADEITHRFRQSADHWRSCGDLDDAALVETIQRDGIDILIDATMLLAGNRIRVLARKPAPLLVSYLAFPGSSGLPGIDYRITDQYQDPPGSETPVDPDKPWVLGPTWAVYDPINPLPDPGPLPFFQNGFLTFGCLNQLCKVSSGQFRLWVEILREVEKSRLVMMSGLGPHREEYAQILSSMGVDPGRLTWLPRTHVAEYFQRHNDIDIALDPFPYPGIRTTCDALWMGVPVVARTGHDPVSRAGMGPLILTGLKDWIAPDPQAYVRIAVERARDIDGLAGLRSTLRQTMRQSPLMDTADFARRWEQAMVALWETGRVSP